MTEIVFALSIIIAAIYTQLIMLFTIGWFRLKKEKEASNIQDVKVSVIIALKNESRNIGKLFSRLSIQDYDPDLLEIVFINDASEDATKSILLKIRSENKDLNIKILETQAGNTGKKNAIEKGIEECSGELIITTDGDCSMGPSWISGMVKAFESDEVKMISGPVRFYPARGLFGMFQALEFSSLVASGAGSIRSGIPIMCNGANLAYRKEAFQDVSGYSGNRDFESGDDIFLMQKFSKKYGSGCIGFTKDNRAIVDTRPAKDLQGLFNQRIRWVSKSKGYSNFWLILTSFTVYLLNFSILLTFLLSLFISGWINLAILLFIIKFLIDLPILVGISCFNKQRYLLWLYPIFQLIYVPYVVLIGLVGNVGKYHWK